MAIDNDVYDRVGATWWEDDNPLVLLHGSMTAGRMQYYRDVLERLGRLTPDGRRPAALDIGSGGGFLAEEFCRLGFSVTGVEPSQVSVRAARAHATASGLGIEYRVGRGEHLPVEDGAFDVACCSDVLEHVADVDGVLAETSRALRPGGVLVFDTPNRTLASRLATALTQRWRLTRVVDFAAHDWGMFLPPAELAGRMRRQGLTVQETVGLAPGASLGTALAAVVGLRRGRLSYRELSERLAMGRSRYEGFFYMGYAVRA
jgi:2-polyprenyl-6-hydroxyphenyl methylase / 3-demethylubiquinone-9 3-methyltransferase